MRTMQLGEFKDLPDLPTDLFPLLVERLGDEEVRWADIAVPLVSYMVKHGRQGAPPIFAFVEPTKTKMKHVVT
jgi:hypothetical protein